MFQCYKHNSSVCPEFSVPLEFFWLDSFTINTAKVQIWQLTHFHCQTASNCCQSVPTSHCLPAENKRQACKSYLRVTGQFPRRLHQENGNAKRHCLLLWLTRKTHWPDLSMKKEFKKLKVSLPCGIWQLCHWEQEAGPSLWISLPISLLLYSPVSPITEDSASSQMRKIERIWLTNGRMAALVKDSP